MRLAGFPMARLDLRCGVGGEPLRVRMVRGAVVQILVRSSCVVVLKPVKQFQSNVKAYDFGLTWECGCYMTFAMLSYPPKLPSPSARLQRRSM